MDYICSGGGSEFKGTYAGSKTDPQCVIPDHCVPKVGHEHVFPRKLSYVDDSGFASSSLHEDVLRFWLHDSKRNIRHDHAIPPRAPDPDVLIGRDLASA